MKRKQRAVKSGRAKLVPVPFTVFIAVVAAGLFAYLWLCGQCEALGHMLKDAEQEQLALQRRFQNESYQWANLCAPGNIDQALAQHGLNMGWPTRDQIIRLYDVRADRSFSVVGLGSGVVR